MLTNSMVVVNKEELVEFINKHDYTGIERFVCVVINSNIANDTSGSIHDSLEEVIEDCIFSYNTFFTTSSLEVSIAIDYELNDEPTMVVEIEGPMKPEYEDKPETYEDTDIIEDTEIF